MHALLEMASRYAVGGSGNMIHYPEPDEFEKIPKGFYAMSGVELPSNAGSDYVEPDEDDPYNFIEVVFGVQSRQTYAMFIEQTITKGVWIFDAAKIREKLWAHANVPLRHISKK